MAAVLIAMGRFLTPLTIRWTDQAGGYVLHDQFIYETSGGVRITVRPGFLTDLASVPRWALTIVSKGDVSAKAAVIHDALYVWQPCSRAMADLILYEAAIDAGEKPWKAFCMWAAVTMAGGSYWASKDTQAGEKGMFAWEPGVKTIAPFIQEWGYEHE